MVLSLLRSPTSPDPLADRGRHEFTYALLPHAGDFRAGGVIQEAYALNVPLIVREMKPAAGPLPASRSFFQLDQPNVIIEAVKLAEDGGALIVRLYEAAGARGAVTLTTMLPVGKAWLADLMENEIRKVPIKNGRIQLDLSPFEIVTLKLAR
jgi:alpha-mannosidase